VWLPAWLPAGANGASSKCRSSLGYEPYDGRLCRLGRSLVIALTSPDGRRSLVASPMHLPRLNTSHRVSCTIPCTQQALDLRVVEACGKPGSGRYPPDPRRLQLLGPSAAR